MKNILTGLFFPRHLLYVALASQHFALTPFHKIVKKSLYYNGQKTFYLLEAFIQGWGITNSGVS